MRKVLAILFVGLLVAAVAWLWNARSASAPSAEPASSSGKTEPKPELQPEPLIDPPAEASEPPDERSVAAAPPAPTSIEPQAEEVELAEIRGRFLLQGGSPAGGVELEIHGWQANSERVMKFGAPDHWDDLTGQTDSGGNFSILLDPPRAFQFVLEAKLPGWCSASWRWSEIEPASVVDVGEVVLLRGGSIRGRIVDSDGQALGGEWMVYADSAPSGGNDPSGGRDETRVRGAADPQTGTFDLQDIPPGLTKLKAYSRIANWIDGPNVQVREGEETKADITYSGPDNRSRIVVITFCRPFYMFAHQPAEATLSAPGFETRTAKKIANSSQSFSFDDVPAGSYTVEVRDPRFQPWSKSGVRPGEVLQATLKGSANVALRVFDADTQQPVDRYSMDVRFEGVNFHPNVVRVLESTKAPPVDGVFDGMIPGDQTIIVRAEGYAPCELPAPGLKEGETRSLEARLGHGGTLSGRTVCGPKKRAVEGVQLLLYRSTGPDENVVILPRDDDPDVYAAQSDAEGRFAFRGVPPGSYQLNGRLGKVISARLSVLVSETGEAPEVELVLPSPAWLEGKLVGPAGASFDGLRILTQLEEEPGDDPDSFEIFGDFDDRGYAVAADGSFRCGPIRSGPTTVLLGLPDIVIATFGGSHGSEGPSVALATVDLEPDATTRRDIDISASFPGSVAIRGAIDGHPAASVTVSLSDAGTGVQAAVAQLDGSGVGKCALVLPGTYMVNARPMDGSWVYVSPARLILEPGGTKSFEFDVQLVRGALLLINSEDGKPLPSAPVTFTPVVESDWAPSAGSTTDAQGRIELSLPVDRYRVEAGGFPGFDPEAGAIVDWTATGPRPTEVRVKLTEFPR